MQIDLVEAVAVLVLIFLIAFTYVLVMEMLERHMQPDVEYLLKEAKAVVLWHGEETLIGLSLGTIPMLPDNKSVRQGLDERVRAVLHRNVRVRESFLARRLGGGPMVYWVRLAGPPEEGWEEVRGEGAVVRAREKAQ